MLRLMMIFMGLSQFVMLYMVALTFTYAIKLDLYNGFTGVFKRILHCAVIFIIFAILALVVILNTTNPDTWLNGELSDYFLVYVLGCLDLAVIAGAIGVRVCTSKYRR